MKSKKAGMKSKKPEFLGGKKKVRQYWNALYHSTHERMSRGACNINRIISWAKGDNWRRKNKKK